MYFCGLKCKNKFCNVKNKIIMYKQITLATAGLCFALAAAAQPDSVRNTVSGRAYAIVTIGTQTWTAENIADSVYDSQSEAYGDTIFTYSKSGYDNGGTAPYYYDGRHETAKTDKNLNDSLRQRLGLTYNWAAIMGYTSSVASNKTYEESGRRQGICPNGYHVPKQAEISTLLNYIDQQATLLMDSLGWYKVSGSNYHGFGLLPSGYYYQDSKKFMNIGKEARLFLATPDKSNNSLAAIFAIEADTAKQTTVITLDNRSKRSAAGCRCIKNPSTPTAQTPISENTTLYADNGRIFCNADCRIFDLAGRDVTRQNGSLQGIYIVKTAKVVVKIAVP